MHAAPAMALRAAPAEQFPILPRELPSAGQMLDLLLRQLAVLDQLMQNTCHVGVISLLSEQFVGLSLLR